MAKKSRTVQLERLHLQPGWCLVLVDKDDDRIGRVVGFPAGPKGDFRIADAESIVDIDEDAIEIDAAFKSEELELGRYVILPVGKLAAFIAPAVPETPAAPKLVLP